MPVQKSEAGSMPRLATAVVESHTVLRAALVAFVRTCPALAPVTEFAGWPDLVDRTRADLVPMLAICTEDPRSGWSRELWAGLSATLPGLRLVICADVATTGDWPASWTVCALGPQQALREFFVACGLATGDARRVAIQPAALSDREYQVYRGIAAGKPLKRIAADLGVTASTVNAFRKRVLNKLGLADDSELVRHAVSVGLAACHWGCERACSLSP